MKKSSPCNFLTCRELPGRFKLKGDEKGLAPRLLKQYGNDWNSKLITGGNYEILI
jgi:hypothetical protein